MMEHLKTRLLDLIIVWMLVAAGFGAYYVYGRIALHNEMDRRLIDILTRQDEAQLAQRCQAAGFAKVPKDAPERAPK